MVFLHFVKVQAMRSYYDTSHTSYLAYFAHQLQSFDLGERKKPKQNLINCEHPKALNFFKRDVQSTPCH
jgi:hypothetical protein